MSQRHWLLIITVFSIFLAGCSAKDFSLGYEKSYCEEHGCDYTDAGICGDPMEIYKYRKDININDVAYKNIRSESENK